MKKKHTQGDKIALSNVPFKKKKKGQKQKAVYWWLSAKQWRPVTHQACRAQMGSISVMHTMAPRAFRAVQQPFPTYTRARAHMHRREQSNALVNTVTQLVHNGLLHLF